MGATITVFAICSWDDRFVRAIVRSNHVPRVFDAKTLSLAINVCLRMGSAKGAVSQVLIALMVLNVRTGGVPPKSSIGDCAHHAVTPAIAIKVYVFKVVMDEPYVRPFVVAMNAVQTAQFVT